MSLPLAADPRPIHVACYLHSLAGGGVERMRMHLLSRLRELGVRTTLLLHSDAGELKGDVPAGLDVRVFGTGRTLADVGPLARFLRHERPDALLSSLGHNNIAAMMAKIVSRSRCSLIACQHNALSVEVRSDAKYRLLPILYRLFSPVADHLVAVSGGVADDLARQAGIARSRIEVIYNPVITRDFARRADAALDDPWFAAGAPPVYVAVGRLVAQKDHTTLLRAFAAHRRQHPSRLMILGEGPLREQLERQANELAIGADIRLVGYRANPLPYMRRAAAVVLSSVYEGLGNVLIEALACGTPVVSTDCPFGPSEILGGGLYGRLVPSRDHIALALALDPALRQTFPPSMLQARAAEFTVEHAADRYLALASVGGTRRVLA
jgi:glycosyltransferase involved in cell wall biosynthesis